MNLNYKNMEPVLWKGAIDYTPRSMRVVRSGVDREVADQGPAIQQLTHLKLFEALWF